MSKQNFQTKFPTNNSKLNFQVKFPNKKSELKAKTTFTKQICFDISGGYFFLGTLLGQVTWKFGLEILVSKTDRQTDQLIEAPGQGLKTYLPTDVLINDII